MNRLLVSIALLHSVGCVQDAPPSNCSAGVDWTGDPDYSFESSNYGPGTKDQPCTHPIEDDPFLLAADTFNDVMSLDPSDVEANLLEAVGVLNDGGVTAGANFEITLGDLDSAMDVSLDNDSINLVFMVDGVHTDDDTNAGARIRPAGGQTFECDIIVFNQRTHDGSVEFIDWSTDDSTLAPTERSMLRTLTHELGHCLGLGHNSMLTDSIMNNPTPDGTVLAPLSSDDLEALLFIYG